MCSFTCVCLRVPWDTVNAGMPAGFGSASRASGQASRLGPVVSSASVPAVLPYAGSCRAAGHCLGWGERGRDAMIVTTSPKLLGAGALDPTIVPKLGGSWELACDAGPVVAPGPVLERRRRGVTWMWGGGTRWRSLAERKCAARISGTVPIGQRKQALAASVGVLVGGIVD
jgi:hypothetical protein